VITRTLQLPAAGRDFIEPIIEHRLERLTPWRPEYVLYGFAVNADADGSDTVAVDFAATSQDIAARAVSRLSAFNLVPTAIGAAGEPLETPLRIDLYRGQKDPRRLWLRRSATICLSVMGAVLIPLCIATFWLAQAQSAASTTPPGSSLPSAADCKRKLVGRKAGAAIWASSPESSQRCLWWFLIDRLAMLLPPDTYLKGLEINPDSIRMVGVSANAPALIGALDADSALSEVRFSAPVTRGEDNRDSFEITARRAAADAPSP
jgi:general secretion pathway protein L